MRLQSAARFASFSAALAVLVLIVAYPRIIASDMQDVPHGWLVLTMFGMSFLFIYGIGFSPQNRILKYLMHPLAGWAALIAGSLKIFV